MALPGKAVDADFLQMPADEYDDYLHVLWRMAQEGCSAEEIRDYLAAVEVDVLGTPAPAIGRAAFAAALRERWGVV